MSLRHEFDERLCAYACLIGSVTGTEIVLFIIKDDCILSASERSEEILERCTSNSWTRLLRLGPQGLEAVLHIAPRAVDAALVDDIRPAPADELLALVCSGIEREWLQTETIENLSVELGNRYEELNLLYGIDDNLSTAGSESLKTVIGTALENCVDFLNIDGAAVYVPDHDIAIQLNGGDPNELTAFEGDEAYAAAVLGMVRSLGEPLVLNGNPTDPSVLAGTPLKIKLLASPIFEGQQHLYGVMCFIRHSDREPFTTSDRKIAEVVAAEVSKALNARYDGVTGLMHRAAFEHCLEFYGNADESRPVQAALLQIDLDQFKLINDSCGHPAGDRLLRQSAALIRRFAPDHATVARSGADEFAVLVPDMSAEDANVLATSVNAAIATSLFESREKTFNVTASIGITDMSAGKKVSVALNEADIACNVAKELGGGRIRVYGGEDEHMQARHEAMHWASKIRSAVDDDHFELFGQAINPVSDPFNAPSHFEVLLRLHDDDGTIVSPAIFIPAAERHGFMDRIDRLVVSKALETLALYHERGVKAGISLNISGPSMGDDAFRHFVIDAVRTSRIDASSICFEVTETAAISNLGQALLFFEDLGEIGCQFALDDFGSGMSSYAYLRKLPVDYVKIDGAFVKDMVTDRFNHSIVESIHHISCASGKRTVAEFVKDEMILVALQEIGVDFAQGYALDRPGPLAQKLEALLPAAAAAV